MAQKIKAYAGNDPYVFVSYSHKDQAIVMPFIAALQERCNVWFDEGIRFGSEGEVDIAERLESCSLFLFVITENSLQSANCMDEIAFARDMAKPFVNVLTSDGIELTKAFRLRYGRYQMCNLFAYETPKEALLSDIAGEKGAIRLYNEIAERTRSETVRASVERIILDEEIHVRTFDELLETLS